MNVEIYVERNDKEIVVECDCKYWSASRGHCDKYGCPEEPDTPAEIEIQSAVNKETGEEVELTEQEMEKVTEKAFDILAEYERDYPEPDYYHEFDI